MKFRSVLRLILSHENADVYHLNKIYLLNGQQGKNMGKKMLDYIIEEIKKSGAKALQLNVNRYNSAVHFYEKQGFKIIREEDIDIGEGFFMNDYVMEKEDLNFTPEGFWQTDFFWNFSFYYTN